MNTKKRIWVVSIVVAFHCACAADFSPEVYALTDSSVFASLNDASRQKIIRQIKPGMEVRRFLEQALEDFSVDDGPSRVRALFRLKLLMIPLNAGQWNATAVRDGTHTSSSIPGTMNSCFFSQARFFILYDKLAGAGLVDTQTRADAQKVAEAFLQPAERGSNNRALHFALAQAYALRNFPDSDKASSWRMYAEAVWNDFYGPGDNYEPGYVAHWFPQILELGEVLGHQEELKSEKMRLMYARLRDLVSPSGLVVSPGDGHGQESYLDGFVSAAELTGDATLLWAAEQTLKAGSAGYARERNGVRVPESEQAELLKEKLGALYARGISAQVPDSASMISRIYPATYRVDDRLILNPSRNSGNPYAAFYLNDRQNTTFHGHEDNRGDLYHYEVDGTLYLSRSHWSKWPGQANTFVVSDPTLEFPYNQTGGMVSNHWYRMSENMRILLDYQDSAAWQSETPGRKFRETSGCPGYNHVNPDGLSGKCDHLTIRTVSIQLLNFPRNEIKNEKDHRLESLSFDHARVAWYRDYRKVAPSDGPYEVLISRLFIAGQKGERVLENFDRIPSNLKILHYPPYSKDKEPVMLNPAEVLSLVPDPETGSPVLKLTCPLGRTDLILDLEDLTVNLNTDYQRLGCMIQYRSDVSEFLRAPLKIAVNGYADRSMYADHQQGGLLTDSRVEQKNGDCFGSMSYDGVWTFDSSWTRQTLLSAEGLLIVVDRFLPGAQADGMTGGPVWQLFSPPESGLHWFDAVQDFVNGNRLMVFFNLQRGVQYGVQFQPKLWGVNDYAVYARKRLSAGKEEVFVTAFVPHRAAFKGVQISGLPHYMGQEEGRAADSGLRTRVELDGTVTVDWVPPKGGELIVNAALTVRVGRSGDWQISR